MQFSLGEISDVDARLVEVHLAQCSSCLETIGDIQADDTWVAALRAQRDFSATVDESQADLLTLRMGNLWNLSDQTIVPVAQEIAELIQQLSPPLVTGELACLGPYRLLRALGTGGMGIIFEAIDPELRRHVALKVMRPRLAADNSARQRFLREARAVAAIQSDHVIAIHHVGEDNGVAWFAMPLLQGETLEARLAERNLAAEELLRIARETATGLAAAHDRGVIHRDIKPANIFLAHSDQAGDLPRVKILDFGLAQASSADPRLTHAGYLAGTPHYMSPEQARGGAVDVRSDLFSLGCVLYHAATGQPPFARSDTLSTLSALANESPAPVSSINAHVPAALSKAIACLLAKDPQDRFQSANEFLTALQRAESGRSSVAVASIWPWLLALGVVVAVWVVWLTNRSIIGGAGKVHPQASITEELTNFTERIQASSSLEPNKPEFAKLRGDLVKFGATHQGTTAALAAGRLMSQLSWPADAMVRSHISDDELRGAGEGDASRAPPEIVGIFGTYRFGHWWTVTSVAVSDDGKFVASAGHDFALRVWDSEGRLVRSFAGAKREFFGVTFSPDGNFICGGGMDCSAPIWNIETGERLQSIDARSPGWVMEVLFDQKGERLITGDRHRFLKVWNTATGIQLKEFKDFRNAVHSVALARNDELLVAGSMDGSIRAWELNSDVSSIGIPAHQGWVNCVAVTRDGKQVISCGEDGAIKIWTLDDLASSPAILQEKGQGVASLLLMPDEKTLYSGDNDGFIQEWDFVNRARKERWRASSDPIRRLATDRHGLLLAAASYGPSSCAKVWRLEHGTRRPASSDSHGAAFLAGCTDDGLSIWACNADGTFQMWDLATGRRVSKVEGDPIGVNSAMPSHDGKFLVTSHERTICLHDVNKGSIVQSWDHPAPITCVARRRDGLIATGAQDRIIRLCRVGDKEPLELPGSDSQLIGMTFSPDGETLVSISHEGTVIVWDLSHRNQRCTWRQPGGTLGIEFRPDGHRLAIIDPSTHCVQIRDTENWQPVKTDAPLKCTASIGTVGWSPAGDRIVTGSNDGTIRVFDAGTGKVLKVISLGPPTRYIYRVSFTPDGRHLVTGNGNGTVYLLRLQDVD